MRIFKTPQSLRLLHHQNVCTR